MLRTYEGKLKGNQIDWSGEAPESSRPLHVHITVLDKEEVGHQGHRMALALQNMARAGAFADISDPAEWQHKIREGRPLPGRETE